MKKKEIRPDGTVIEIEGDAAELAEYEAGKKNESKKPKKKILHGKSVDDRIQELEDKVDELSKPAPYWPVTVPTRPVLLQPCFIHDYDRSAGLPTCRRCGQLEPNIITTTICDHRFPSSWMGINPPPCEKCGFTPPNMAPTYTLSERLIDTLDGSTMQMVTREQLNAPENVWVTQE